MNLPVIAVPAFEDANPYCGLPNFVKDMARPYFQLMTEAEVNDDPNKYGQIVGLLSHPGWKFTTPTVMDKLSNLKVVSTVSAGYNHLDLKYLKNRNIRVGYTPNTVNDCVGDLAMTLILATSRKMKAGIDIATSKEEVTVFKNIPPVFGNAVTGTTLGIVGMGGIGYEVAKRSVGFRMKVLYHNRNKREDDQVVNAQFCPSLQDMLPQCDFVVITCSLNDSTKHMFSDKEFKLMKNTSTIINVSRGPTIDHDALTRALKNNEIRAAGLDVTEPEPLPRDHPLLDMDTVTITPHIGSQTMETRKIMWQRGIDNLKAALIDNSPMPSELTLNSQM